MAEATDAAVNDNSTPLKTAGDFVATVLKKMTIKDSLSGKNIDMPVENVTLATGTMRGQDGVINQSLHFKIEGTKELADLDQAAILRSAEAVLGQIPSLAQNFSFGGTPAAGKPLAVAHNWRDDNTLDVKFDLPQGLEPAVVVKEILAMAQGAALAAPQPAPASASATSGTSADTPATSSATQQATTAKEIIGKATEQLARQREAANDQSAAQGVA